MAVGWETCNVSLCCTIYLYFYILQLSSEDGGGLRDLLTQASMDYRISSYRLIMDSTRSILNSDSSCGSPPLDSGLEDVFEELADGLDYPRGTLSHSAYIFSGFFPHVQKHYVGEWWNRLCFALRRWCLQRILRFFVTLCKLNGALLLLFI